MNWTLRQISEIRIGGIPILFFKIKRLFYRIIWVFSPLWSIPGVLIIRVIRPWILIRMQLINGNRIGHFSIEASIYLAHQSLQNKKQRILNLFFIWNIWPCCNSQWDRMVRRQLNVYWWVEHLLYFNRLIPGGEVHLVPSAYPDRDHSGLIHRTKVRFEFTSEEKVFAKSWLKKRGWQEGEPFVCLLVRDSSYLASLRVDYEKGLKECSYQNHRDSDIETYIPAIKRLVEEGFWVIRMGKVMDKPMSWNHSKVIDYPFVEDQDDLMDVWLSANCYLFISTACGLDGITDVYRRPLLFINVLPLSHWFSWSNNIIVPKHLVWKDTGKNLTLLEHWEHNYMELERYVEAGIYIINLTSQEIVEAVLEKVQRIAGTWHDSAEDVVRQKKFFARFKISPKFSDWDYSSLHGWIHPEARIGANYLRTMGDAFLE